MRRKHARRIRAGIAAAKMSDLGQALWLFNVADDLALRSYWRSRARLVRTSPDFRPTDLEGVPGE